MNLYIVFGSSDLEGDGTDWMVAGYQEEMAANQHVKMANDWVKENRLGPRTAEERKAQRYREHMGKKNPWDKGMYCDYAGVIYDVRVVMELQHPDQYQQHHGD